MKRIFLLFVLAACGGGSTTDNDAGNTNDSGNDVTSANDSSSPTDASSSDVATSSDTGFGDGSIGPNQECDPNNNQCNPTLLCCSEPTHIPDASTHYVCEPPDKTNQCPKLP